MLGSLAWLPRRTACLLLLAVTISQFTGCGESPPPRAVVSGSVTYQGKPVDFGDILFHPQMENTGGLFAQGKIVGGKYSLDADHGPLVGKNIVRIHGYKMTGRKRLDIAGKSLSDAPEMVDELMPYIPEKFNEASEIMVEIEPGGSDRLDFNL